MKYGRLTPIRRVGSGPSGHILWECLCDCGNIKITTASQLKHGQTRSCGCIKKDMVMDEQERFDRLWVPIPECGCWIWLGGVNGSSKIKYGTFTIPVDGKWKNVSAHRHSWILKYGPIPDGMFLCHKCDVPLCVNPDHLFLGTAKDNCHDMMKKGRQVIILPPPRPGIKHHNAKLTDEDIRAIRGDGRSSALISVEYGVSRTTITMIKARTRWAHVE